MLRTRVGYCGGEVAHPTYRSIGDHTEAISIDFDPANLRYEDLLTRFWDNHYCSSNVGRRQYMNALFYQNDEQQELAEATRVTAAEKSGIPVESVQTAILPAGIFTYAEGYHQKYALTSHHELRAFLSDTIPAQRRSPIQPWPPDSMRGWVRDSGKLPACSKERSRATVCPRSSLTMC